MHFPPVQRVDQIVCMFYLAPARAAFLGVGWQGGSSSIFGPTMGSIVGICPVLFFS